MLALILASGICGLLLGRYFKVYVCFPTILILIPAAYFIGDGLTGAILTFVLSSTATQLCYLIGAASDLIIERFRSQTSRTEDFI
ncbi:hypothetical protein FBZ93_111208 [Bradyrhizobium macuxiense]|uniref:Uncharacterized protein n=1 Tax=Bradyrhizobium macuxiense TaxID=1755647 RepID=A0A560LD89_9BRAD|nr:hypothetical protein [Bradyrhizobium macuxiense]TWB93169.1 hypothetical protein FBZ93_111208 [Bradyrhizobium macuxiense]